MLERIKKFLKENHKTRKVTGVVLIVLGFLAFITPLTPGSWLALVGLELLGFDLIFWNRIKEWWREKGSKKT